MTDNDSSEVEIIPSPINLRDKVKEIDEEVNLALLQRAEKAIKAMSNDYVDWVQEDMKKLQAAFDKAKKAKGDSELKSAFGEVFEVAHDMKGQGGSFDYNLITIIGDSLCRFIEKKKEYKQADIEVLEVHVNSIRLVITNGMKGDGGEVGKRILQGLNAVVSKKLS